VSPEVAIGISIVAVVFLVFLITLLVLRIREQDYDLDNAGRSLYEAQQSNAELHKSLAAATAATQIAETQLGRAQAVLLAIRGEIAGLNKRIATGPLPIDLRTWLQQLQGSVEAGCFAAGSIPPKEKTR